MRSRRRNRPWLAIGVAFLTLLGTAQLADVSEAAVQTCVAGPVYDPACDVDHDGDVDVLDIQLAAGHWNQSGTWTGGDYWSLVGNAATSPTVNFLGTTDRQALVVRTNNTERLRVTDNGLVGIGTASPVDQLSVRNTGSGRAGFFQTDNSSNNAAALSTVVQDGNGNALFSSILDQAIARPRSMLPRWVRAGRSIRGSCERLERPTGSARGQPPDCDCGRQQRQQDLDAVIASSHQRHRFLGGRNDRPVCGCGRGQCGHRHHGSANTATR